MKLISHLFAGDGWKKIVVLAAVGVNLGAAAQPAHAQGTGLIPLRAKVGVTLPQSSETKSFSGSTGFTGEVDVRLPWPSLSNMMFSAGYQQSSRSGRRLRIIPLTVSKVFGPPNPLSGVTGNPYFGVGAGAYLLRASGNGDSESATRPGAFGMVGYQFPNPYFVEAKYHLIGGKVGGIRANSLAIMVGRHF